MNYVSIKTPNGYKYFKCCDEIYTYIKQLEYLIRYPGQSKLRELYPGRFTLRVSKNEKARRLIEDI